jgi:hypothetical protein
MYTPLKQNVYTAQLKGMVGVMCLACTNIQPIQSDIYSSVSTAISQNKVSMRHLFIYLSVCLLATFQNFVRVNYLVFFPSL